MDISTETLLAIGQIIWIDLLLSGDNAVVIALACRSLPEKQKRWGIILGAGAAIVLRILFALVVSQIMLVPFLMTAGGLLLLWIAVKLLRGEHAEEKNIPASDKLWHAVRTIAMADIVMSLDNVVAISAASGGNYWLFIFGLAVSIPLIVVGATLVTELIRRFPLFVWAGAALLGWISGEMIARDPALHNLGLPAGAAVHYALALGCAVLVVVVGYWLKRRETETETA
ncbi:MAG: YjbE family putative metal transport protein [Rhizobiales bacterium]|nr:YjbE family putative metal transport protein [Hyphomicrobiales bacterium]